MESERFVAVEPGRRAATSAALGNMFQRKRRAQRDRVHLQGRPPGDRPGGCRPLSDGRWQRNPISSSSRAIDSAKMSGREVAFPLNQFSPNQKPAGRVSGLGQGDKVHASFPAGDLQVQNGMGNWEGFPRSTKGRAGFRIRKADGAIRGGGDTDRLHCQAGRAPVRHHRRRVSSGHGM